MSEFPKPTCPGCGGPWPAEDQRDQRLCPACRDRSGTWIELSIEAGAFFRLGPKAGNPEKFPEWPIVRDLGRMLFRHPTFDASTWEALQDRLLRLFNGDAGKLLMTPRPEIVAILEAELGRLNGCPSALAATSDPEAASDDLTESEREALQALCELDATTADKRRTLADIAEKAQGQADPELYKWAVSQLGHKGFVHTKRGRQGGIWLTIAGQERATKR